MWTCKHCKLSFDFERTTEKGNHSRHCEKNPRKQESYQKCINAIHDRLDRDLGSFKKFVVKCFTCKSEFDIEEREKKFPEKSQYFCSRNCANSTGGKAKAEKYGYSQYRTIAEKFYKPICVVCGITDILDVHHIDENRENIHPSNLIFLCPNDHFRLHRNGDEKIKQAIEGHGTAWGGHFFCKEDISRVRIPDAPPKYFLT